MCHAYCCRAVLLFEVEADKALQRVRLPTGQPGKHQQARSLDLSIDALDRKGPSTDTYAAHEHDERALASLDFQSQINLLKVEASELAVATVMSAMRACGLSGYRNDGAFSVGRHLRDVLSAPLMINNDRILANIATASLMSGVPASLRD